MSKWSEAELKAKLEENPELKVMVDMGAIQKAKDDLAEAKAQKRVLLNALKKDFNIENLIEADEESKKLTKELDVLNINIEKDYNQLKEKFNFI